MRLPRKCTGCHEPQDLEDILNAKLGKGRMVYYPRTNELLCSNCQEDGEEINMQAEFGTYHARNGSVVG